MPRKRLDGTVQIKKASDFAAYLEEHWDADNLLFRGQCQNRPLVPRIGRLELWDDIPIAERLMLDEFKRKALPFLNCVPQDDWDRLALAQHHGLATRLLDWTANPIAALWFAVERPAPSNAPGVVWIFETQETDYAWGNGESTPFTGRKTRVFRPRHITPRIIAQSGWFTVHKYLEDRKGFVPLEDNKLYRDRLVKVEIPARSFSLIRRELDRWGFNAATLYVDLDGLCRYIEWQRSLLPDERSTRQSRETSDGVMRRRSARAGVIGRPSGGPERY